VAVPPYGRVMSYTSILFNLWLYFNVCGQLHFVPGEGPQCVVGSQTCQCKCNQCNQSGIPNFSGYPSLALVTIPTRLPYLYQPPILALCVKLIIS